MRNLKIFFDHITSASNALVTVAMFALLAGCANYRGISSDKSPRDATSYATAASFANDAAAGTWPDEHWWNEFGDRQLGELIDEALAHNPALDAAVARVHAAQAYTGDARSAQSPNINASGDFQWERLSENGLFPPPIGGSFDSNNTVHLNVGYELDFWGKNRSAVRAALSQERAAQAEQEAAKLMISSAVTKTYIGLFRLYTLRDVIEQTLHQHEQIYALTGQRVSAGLDSRAELKQAEEQLPALRGQLAQVDESIGAMRNALAQLLGVGPDRGLQITRPQLIATQSAGGLPLNLPADLLGRRPDIVAARWRVEAALRDVDVAKSQFYPNVNLNAFVGVNSLGLGDLTDSGSKVYGYGPAIRLPIFAGGKLRQNLKGKYAAYDGAVASYDQTLTAALRDVADQLNAQRWLDVREREQQSALTIAREAFDIATRRYRAGLGNYLSVLNAQALVLAQEQAGVELHARALEIRVSLIQALGGGFSAQAVAADPAATHSSSSTSSSST